MCSIYYVQLPIQAHRAERLKGDPSRNYSSVLFALVPFSTQFMANRHPRGKAARLRYSWHQINHSLRFDLRSQSNFMAKQVLKQRRQSFRTRCVYAITVKRMCFMESLRADRISRPKLVCQTEECSNECLTYSLRCWGNP